MAFIDLFKEELHSGLPELPEKNEIKLAFAMRTKERFMEDGCLEILTVIVWPIIRTWLSATAIYLPYFLIKELCKTTITITTNSNTLSSCK